MARNPFPLAFTKQVTDSEQSGVDISYKGFGLGVNQIWSLAQRLNSHRHRKAKKYQEIKEGLCEIAEAQKLSQFSVFRLMGSLKHCSKDWLSDKVQGSPELLHSLKFDASGAALIHQLYNARKYTQGRYLVRKFPEYCLCGMSGEPAVDVGNVKSTQMPFTGQNILHIAILQGNHEEAKWLMDFYQKFSLDDLRLLLTERVTGSMFRPNGANYFGETPLQFAACSNDCDMFDLVMSYASSLHIFPQLFFGADSHGNNLIHLCVLNDLPKMCTHIKMRAYSVLRQELLVAWHESRMLSCGDPLRKSFLPEMISKSMDGRLVLGGYCRKPEAIAFPTDRAQLEWPVLYYVFRELGQVSLSQATTRVVEEWLYDRWRWTASRHDRSREHFQQWVSSSHLVERWILQRWLDFTALTDETESLRPDENWPDELLELDRRVCALFETDEVNEVLRDPPALDSETQKFVDLIELWMIGSWIGNNNEVLDGLLEEWLAGNPEKLSNGAIQQLYQNRLMLSLNNLGFSPVALAAKHNNKTLLQMFFQEATLERWSGDACVDLAGVEFPLALTDREGHSLYDPPVSPTLRLKPAMQWLCANDADKLSELFQISLIPAIIRTKWERVGRSIMARNLVVVFVVAVLLSLLCCLEVQGFVGYEDKDKYRARSYFYAGLAGIFFLEFWTELPVVVRHGLDYWGWHGGIRGIAIVDKLCGTFVFGSFCIALVDFIVTNVKVKSTTVSHGFLAGATIVSWLHLFVYLAAFQRFGAFLTKVIVILRQDVLYFCQLYIIFNLSFGVSLALVAGSTKPLYVQPTGNFRLAWVYMWELLKSTFGVDTGNENPLTVESVENPKLRGFFGFLLFLYGLIVSILLLNLLIAMMTRTYEDFTLHALAKSFANKYILTVSLHRSLDPSMLKRLVMKYTYSSVRELETASTVVTRSDLSSRDTLLSKEKSDKLTRNPLKESKAMTNASSRGIGDKIYFELSKQQRIEAQRLFANKDEVIESPPAEQETLPFLDSNSRKPDDLIQASTFWVNKKGEHPAERQVILYEEVVDGSWRPSNVKQRDFCLFYCRSLWQQDRKLVIQPQRRNVLLIINPQNDFHDFSPSDQKILKGLTRTALYTDAERKAERGSSPRLGRLVAKRESSLALGSCVNVFAEDSREWKKAIVVDVKHRPVVDSIAPGEEVFYDVAVDPYVGSMAIPGAFQDSCRVASLLEKYWWFFDEVIVTQEAHFKSHIAHKWFWKSKDERRHPQEKSVIRYIDIRKGVWTPQENKYHSLGYALKYTAELERGGRFLHTIWPDHCLVGSSQHDPEQSSPGADQLVSNEADGFAHRGQQIVRVVRNALRIWKRRWMVMKQVHKDVNFVSIGSNRNCDIFSVLAAEQCDQRDPLSGIQTGLLKQIDRANELFVCGQALSHAVRFTVEDISKYGNLSPESVTVLMDGSSSATDSTVETTHCLTEWRKAGIQTKTCKEVEEAAEIASLAHASTIGLKVTTGETANGEKGEFEPSVHSGEAGLAIYYV